MIEEKTFQKAASEAVENWSSKIHIENGNKAGILAISEKGTVGILTQKDLRSGKYQSLQVGSHSVILKYAIIVNLLWPLQDGCGELIIYLMFICLWI